MGVESYGLVGFYLTLQALFAVLDMGLTATVSRELARLSATDDRQDMHDLVRTLELVYWCITVVIFVIVGLLAPWIAKEWLNASTLSEETVQLSLMLMGAMIALRMPYGFYGGGLLGLQRQTLLNVIKVVVETLRSGGVVFVLWLASSSIVAFFQWQLAITAMGTVWMAVALWKSLPFAALKASFHWSIFHRLWQFVAGMSLIAILSVVLMQSDKVLLSKLLPLKEFGYYMLASTVAMGLYVIVGPVFAAVYPRFAQMVSAGEEQGLIRLYHKSCQFMTVLVMPVAAVVCVFSTDLLLIWTQNAEIADKASPILSLLIIGTSLNGMMNIPYALQLAYGWTRLVVYLNGVALIVLIPGLIVAVDALGAIGGALIWVCLNVGYILFGVIFMHRKILTDELARWVIEDFAWPALLSFVAVIFSWWVMPDTLMQWQCIAWILMTGLFSVFAALMAAPGVRRDLIRWYHSMA